MKIIRITIIWAFSCTFFLSHAQDVSLKFNKSVEFIDYKDSDTLKIPFTATVEGRYLLEKDDKISLSITSNIPELNFFQIKKEFKLTGSKIQDTLIFHNGDKTLGDLKAIVGSIIKKKKKHFKIVSDTLEITFVANSKTITIDKKDFEKTIILKDIPKKKKQSYNFFLGTNFDFNDKVKANSFYSEIDVFLENLFFKNKKENLWGGIRAGISKNKSQSIHNESKGDINVFDLVENHADSSFITIEEKLVTRTPKTTYDNLSFYTELLLRIHISNNGKFRAFIAPHAEIIQRIETTSYDLQDFISLGKSYVPKDSLNSPTLRYKLSRNREKTRKFFNSYFGVGFPLKYNDNKIEIFLNPVFGMGDSSPIIKRSGPMNKAFGLFQFHIEEKNHGIKLSGEIRKYFSANQDPFIVINLSKRINIESLLDSDK